MPLREIVGWGCFGGVGLWTACAVLFLVLHGCGGRERPDGTVGHEVEIIDATDAEALAGCYAPLRVPGVDGQTTQNCATECERGSLCSSVCAVRGEACPTGDGSQGQAGACDHDAAEVLRSIGYEVPKWPMKRCD